MHRQLLPIIFIFLFLISCAGNKVKVEHEVREPSGEPFPDPIFMLQTIDQERPIRITFFYPAIEYHKDIDGSMVGQKSYLDPRQHHYFKSEADVKLVLRVLNPTNDHYKVFIQQKIEFSDGGDMQTYHMAAESDMKYREFFRQLPTWKGVERVSYLVVLTNGEDNPLISTRGINYSIRSIR